MEILSIKTYSGPNLWSYKPLVHMIIDIGEYETKPSDAIEGFTDRLLELLPSLQNHKCSVGVPGGFIQRLRTGTWMGHIVEHVAIELQVLAGNEVAFGKCRSTDTDGVYNVVFEFLEEKVGLEAAYISLDLVESVAKGFSFDLKPRLNNLAQMVADRAYGPSTLSIIQEAKSRGIPIIRLNDANLVQLGYGKFQERIQATTTSMTKMIAVDIACDKDLTKKLLADVGIPVPQGVVVDNVDDAIREGEEIGYPLVVKPEDLSQGRGITLNIENREMLVGAINLAQEYTNRVVLEKFLLGKDYRILVVNGKVIAVSERLPAQVVGDGKSTVQELIDTLNEDPRRGVGHEKVLTQVRVDVPTKQLLNSQNMTLESVPAKGLTVLLKATANLSTGGTAVDRTDEIHVDNIEMAIRASKVIGLDIAGIDLITPDITQPTWVVGGGIVEINAAPGFRMHVAPSEGKPRPVAKAVVDMLFPPGKNSRVPIVAITGTNGKTTTARMVAHIMKMSGRKVGLTTTDAIYIDGRVLRRGDMTGPWSARMVLKDPTIDFAVLETARGGMLRSGLGFERCDVGAVLNVSDDHLGQGGIKTLEELAYVKQMIIDVVRKQGYGVFNAEDPLSYGMVDKCDGQRTFFSLNPRALRFVEALEDGALGATFENETLVLREGRGRVIEIVPAVEVPATYGGLSEANIRNALAAILMVYVMGASVEDIRQGLKTFDASYHLTPGRLNMIPVRDFRVLIDYAHNIAAYETMANFVAKLRKTRAIGVIACPGDRQDANLIRMGEIAGPVFDQL
ncbi:MAG TPA: cyanophycin synthetase, partial [Candidatus Xenobia bacterium]